MSKQKIRLVLAILLTFGGQCYCSTTEATSQTSRQFSTTTDSLSVSTNKESTTNGNTFSGSEHSSTNVSSTLLSTNLSTASTEVVSTKVTTDFLSSIEGSTSSSKSSTNSPSTISGAVKNETTIGINTSSSNAPITINTTTTGEPTTSQQPTTKQTNKGTTGKANNISGPSKNKGEPMSLEEKQRRNGIVSASICVGSLVLIGIAYLSSFVDKPSEKVPKLPKNNYNREETNSKAHTKSAGTKKISFDNELSIQETPTKSSYQTNLKSPIKSDQIESPVKTDQIELHSVEDDDKNIQNENRRRTGWDVLSKDPSYFDNYQPKHTTTQAEVNEM